MSNLSLYLDTANKRLLDNPASQVPASLADLFQGDSVDLDLYFLSPTGEAFRPYDFKDYASPTIRLGIGKIAVPTGGTFILTDGGQTTAAIASNAAAATVQTAVRAALTTNWSLATVTGNAGGPWLIDRGANGNVAQLTADGGNLLPDSVALVKPVRNGAVALHEVQQVALLQLAAAYTNSWTPVISADPSPAASTPRAGDQAGASAPTVATIINGNGSTIHEIQRFTFAAPPTSGTYTLTFTFTEGTTVPIAWNADAAAILAAILTVMPASSVTVTGVVGSWFQITWVSFANQTQLTIDVTNLKSGSTSEIQRVTFASPPLAGTFTLTFTEGTTGPIAFNASASDIANAINAVLGSGAVTVSMVAGVFFDIAWADTVNHTQVTIDATGLQRVTHYAGTLNLDTLGVDQMIGDSAEVTDAIMEIEVTPSGGTAETLLHREVTVVNDLLENGIYAPTPNPTAAAWPNRYVLKTANYTAKPGDRILADTTSAPFTVTLPLTPSVGDAVEFADAQGTFAANNLTIARNGQLVDGAAADLVADTDDAAFDLVFSGGATGWQVIRFQ